MNKKERKFNITEGTLESKKVLAFDAAGNLAGMFPSVSKAGELMCILPQAISAVCSGKATSSGGMYFRHLDSDLFTITSDDLDTLNVRDYDNEVGEFRIYRPYKELNKARKRLTNKLKK